MNDLQRSDWLAAREAQRKAVDALLPLGRCQHCRHWGKSTTQEADEILTSFPGGPHHQPCMHPSVGGGSYNDAAHKALDGVDSYTTISTGPSFGCVHFEGEPE